MLPAIFFVIGSAFGSFTHLVSDRLYAASIFGGRSHCDACGKKLTFSELFPILSFLFQKGRCKNCGFRLPVSYLITEIVFGVLFLLLYLFFLKDKGLSLDSSLFFAFYSVFFVVSGVLVLYDIKHKILPASFLYAFLALSAVMMAIRIYATGNNLELFSPLILALPVYFLYIVTKKKGIGLGDMFLFSGVGMFLGIEQGIAAALIALWSAAIVAIILQLINKDKYTRKYELPFVPFIILGMLVSLLGDISVWTIVNFFS